MPNLTPRNSIPTPLQSESPNEATAMANMVGQIDRRLVPRFTNTADRTSRVPSPSAGMIGYMLDTHSFVIYRDSAWTFCNFTRTVAKSVNTVRTSTTTQTADPELTIDGLYAGRTYIIEAAISMSSDTGVDGAVKFTFPASTTGSTWWCITPVLTTDLTNSQVALGSTTTPGQAIGVGGVGTGQNAAVPIWMKAVVVIGTNGSVTFDWSQNTLSALATTVWANSWISATMIA